MAAAHSRKQCATGLFQRIAKPIDLLVLLLCLFCFTSCKSDRPGQAAAKPSQPPPSYSAAPSSEVNLPDIQEPSASAESVLPFSANTVKSVTVSYSSVLYPPYTLTDADDIQVVYEYLDALRLGQELDPNTHYIGGGYFIEFTLKDGSRQKISLVGNRFLSYHGIRREVPYEQAASFDAINAKFIREQYEQQGAQEVCGQVISVRADQTGATTNCSIKTENGTVYYIQIDNDAHIIDATSEGWLILHNGDTLAVAYTEPLSHKKLNAEAIFILEHENPPEEAAVGGS